MTREEEIRNAAYGQYCNSESICFTLMCNSFKQGVKWADAHPINVWHKSTEQPEYRALILCFDKHNRWHIGILDIDENLSAIWYLGLLQCYWEDVKIWAYISDLFPIAT